MVRAGRSPQWRALALGLVLAPLAGCYSYYTVEPVEVTPGDLVRARITAVEADRLEGAGQLPTESRILEGRFIERNGQGMLLDVPSTIRRTGAGLEVLHQRIALDPRGVLEFERKQLDRLRTGAVVAVGTAVLGAVVITQLQGEPGKNDPGGGGQPERRRPHRIPLLRISF